MRYAEFKNIIESKWAEKFNGKCFVELYKSFGKYITINFYISPKKEVTWLNDMLHFNLMIELPENFNDEDELPEVLTLESNHNCYFIKPGNIYLCYERRKIPFRKSRGNAEKIAENIGKSINKLYEMLKEDIKAEKIHDNHINILMENIK